VRACVHVTHSE